MAESETMATGVGTFLPFDNSLVQGGPCGPNEVSAFH